MKTCSDCNTKHPLENFYRNRSTPDGKDRICKACRAVKNKAWRTKHPHYDRDYKRAMRAAALKGGYSPREYGTDKDTN